VTVQLAQVLAAAPGASVYLGQVVSVDADDTLTLTVGGGLLPGVPRLRSYVDPAAGDVVYVLATGGGSSVVIGAEVPRVVEAAPPDELTPVLVNPRELATYDREAETWQVSWQVRQDPTHAGAIFYPLAEMTAALTRRPRAIEVLLFADGAEPLGLTLVENPRPAGVFTTLSPVHLVQVPAGGAWVRLPMAWAAPLGNGVAGGIGIISNTNTAPSVADGTLRVTPL
jgi:hypothetical protein